MSLTRSQRAGIFVILALVMAASVVGGAGSVEGRWAAFSGRHIVQAPADTIDYLKGPGHPGIVQSSFQNQLVRPGRTALGKNEAPLNLAVLQAFTGGTIPSSGFVLHLFNSHSSFLIENEHSSRAPPGLFA